MIEKILKYKMYMSRSYSHLSVFMAPITSIVGVVTLLKVYGVGNLYLSILLAVFVLSSMLIIGKLDVDKKVYEKEININNKNNPQLRMISEINERLKKIEGEMKYERKRKL